MNDTRQLIAYMREENEFARKHGCEMLQMQMHLNFQRYQVLLRNMRNYS